MDIKSYLESYSVKNVPGIVQLNCPVGTTVSNNDAKFRRDVSTSLQLSRSASVVFADFYNQRYC